MTTEDLEVYRKYNRDLVTMSDEELRRHYDTYGVVEDRIKNATDVAKALAFFDVKAYRRLNADLASLNDDELTDHWLSYGRREKRQCNDDPDLALTVDDPSFIRRVDMRKVAKYTQEAMERVSAYKTKNVGKDRHSVFDFLNTVLTKTNKNFDTPTRRYLGQLIGRFLVDIMYCAGDITDEERVQLTEPIRVLPHLFDRS